MSIHPRTPAIDHYQAVFFSAPDGILLVDAEGTILEANPEAHRLFEYSENGLVGRPVEILVPESVRGGHHEHREGYLADPRPRPMGIGMELAGVRSDGTSIPVEISLSPLTVAEGYRIVVIVRDLSERLRLRGFGAASLRAAEEERRRIARELHDDTAQSLAALLLRLRVLEHRLEGSPAAEEVAALREGVHVTMEGVRGIARGLRPPELEDAGLEAALRFFLRTRYPGVEATLHLDGSEDRLSTEESLVLYRIAQEALANAVRHGGAKRVELTIRAAEPGGGVLLEVVDDGCGFDPDRHTEPGAGLGLVGMDERAQLVGGRFELRSGPGAGTRIRVHLPMRREGSHG